MSAFDLSGRRALVTGAGQGIGAAIATRMAEAGAEVVAANRTYSHAQKLVDNLATRGLTVRPTRFDDLTRHGLASLVDETARDGLDILVHNAGGCPWSSFEVLEEDKLEAIFALNLNACF